MENKMVGSMTIEEFEKADQAFMEVEIQAIMAQHFLDRIGAKHDSSPAAFMQVKDGVMTTVLVMKVTDVDRALCQFIPASKEMKYAVSTSSETFDPIANIVFIDEKSLEDLIREKEADPEWVRVK